MYRIQNETIDEFIINKSRFITYLKRTDNEEAAKAYISEIKKLHPKATHHCQAFLIDESIQRSNDDGEPAGTAGIPMLEVLRKREMELITAVVVRYYGGIQLGAGGLIRAYSKGVNDALNQATIYKVKHMQQFKVSVSYQYADQIEHYLSSKSVIDKNYELDVTFIYLDDDDSLIKTINEISRGSATIKKLESIETEVEITGSETND